MNVGGRPHRRNSGRPLARLLLNGRRFAATALACVRLADVVDLDPEALPHGIGPPVQ